MSTSRKINHDSGAFKKFKTTFIQEMKIFKEKTDCLSSGDSAYSNGWRGTFILGGTSIGLASVSAVVAVVGAAGILSAAASAGVSIAVTVVGLAVAEGYNFYRSKKKKAEYKRAANILSQDNIFDHIEEMADILMKLYCNQLNNCTEQDADRFASACFSAISYELRTNKYLRFVELHSPEKLQEIIFKGTAHVKDAKITMSGLENKKYHAKGIMEHAALYCSENQSVYSCKSSKPEKYGVLFFETKDEIDQYRLMVAKQKKDDKKWRFEKIHPMKAEALRQSVFFKVQGSDVKCGRPEAANDDSMEKEKLTRKGS